MSGERQFPISDLGTPVNDSELLIRNISDTAILAAIFRARENERSDALFRDPFARRLSGERGEKIFQAMREKDRNEWAWVARTYQFDHFITREIAQGVDMVINLAAGLDARPYRMPLPPSLQWVEVDLPDLLAYKEAILENEKPACVLERVSLDLGNEAARGELFERLGRRSRKALIITEGLLIYLTADEVGALARDLAAPPSFQRWVIDLVSPGLLRILQKQLGPQLSRAGAPLKFGPEEGPGFFAPYGWHPLEVQSTVKTARRRPPTARCPRVSTLRSHFREMGEPAVCPAPEGDGRDCR